MAHILEELRTYLDADSGVDATTSSIYVNHVPETKSTPYIFIQQFGRAADRTIDGSIGPTTYFITLDCVSTSLNTAKDLADACITALDGKSVTMGSTSVAFCWASDVEDDYDKRQTHGDKSNFHIASIEIELGLDAR